MIRRGWSLGLLALVFVSGAFIRAEEPYEPSRLEKEVLVTGCEDAIEMEVLSDGRILFIERAGVVKMYQPAGKRTVRLGDIPTVVFGEVGLVGLAADPNFARTGWIYLLYCPRDNQKCLRVVRHAVKGDLLDPAPGVRILETRIDAPEAAIHMGGGIAFDGLGNLCIGLGDNSPPIPELPVDQRPGHERHDALRSAANSRDLRGKVLRIHPEPDGSYTIPPDNLFADGKDGRPEIYAMGCRNPFRVLVDHRTNWIYWGDVGPNVIPEIKVGPNGYDEVNQARKAGNFGWPMFTGPNEAYSEFDFVTRKAGVRFDVDRPTNRSKNNTGLKVLPPPQPALLWYSTAESKEFPELGSGGRSIIVGPVYYADAAPASPLRLPDRYDRTLFIAEWMRNWIKAVKLTADGRLERIESFADGMSFARPIDLRVGPEGALYVLEYGEAWNDNRNGKIVRLVYRRGNRAPVPVLTVAPAAGRQPLKVALDGSRSYDKDVGDNLTYHWRVNGKPLDSSEPTTSTTFDRPGAYQVELTVADAAGATATTNSIVRVGNAAPLVRILEPRHGGFYDLGRPFSYRVAVDDFEDGSTEKGTLPADRVLVSIDARPRRFGGDDDPGLALMRKSSCFACHTAEGQSKGPPYQSVAQRYRSNPAARDLLAKKIVSGGGGVWGAYPMPPNPQHTLDQTRLMVDWVLGLATSPAPASSAGCDGGYLPTKARLGTAGGGVLLLTAAYTDRGSADGPPQTGEASVVLHARRTKAAFHDRAVGAQVVDDLEGEHGAVVRFAPGDSIIFTDVDLAGIDAAIVRLAALPNSEASSSASLELHADSPTGPLLATFEAPSIAREVRRSIRDPSGVHDLYFTAQGSTSSSRKILSMTWVEFADSPAATAARTVARNEARKRIAATPQQTEFKRTFVRAWTIAELTPHLKELDAGRSLDRGKQLFQTLACASCHRIAGAGGLLGPDLTEVAKRLGQKEPDVRAALLREIVEPSKVIDPKYRTRLIETIYGERLAGIVLDENDASLRIAANAARPEEVRTIAKSQIERITKTDLSLMPVGLLNVLTKEELLDLLAYVERGGRK